MAIRTTPPCRADRVGSFLRPAYLLQAREQKARGEMSAEQLRAVEDRAITEVVQFQRDCGLTSITDGSEELAPPVIMVIDTVCHVRDIQRADFEHLQSQINLHARGCTPKVTLPSPTMLHSLFAASCRYVQMDDTNMAYMCDEKMREAAPPARRRPQRAAAPLRRLHQQSGGERTAGHDPRSVGAATSRALSQHAPLEQRALRV